MGDVIEDSLWRRHKYAAFISYSRADMVAGERFQRGIERYRIPKPLVARGTLYGPVPKRLVPIFRDITDMVAAGDLGAQIEKTLEESAFLILICSPNSAKSAWVNTEIETFKRKGAKTRIIPVLLNGDPVEYHPEHAPNGAFPPALMRVLGPDGKFTDEREPMPIAPDLRPTAEGYNYAVLKTVATMIGLAPDILSQRQTEMERRDRRIARIITSVVTVLAVAATGAAIAAWQQMITARENQSRAFAGLAWNTIEDGNYDLGARLGLQALPAGQGNIVKVSSADAEDAMQSALWNNRVTARFLPEASTDTDPVTHMELSRDGSTAAIVSTVGSVRVIDVASGRLLMSAPYAGRVAESDFESMYSAALSPDGKQLMTFAIFPDERTAEFKACGLEIDPADENGPWFNSAGTIWDTSTGCPVQPLGNASFNVAEGGWFSVAGFEWSPDGTRVLVTSWGRNASRVLEVASGAILYDFGSGSDVSDWRFSPMPQFSSDGTKILAKTGNVEASLLDAATGKLIRSFVVPENLDEWGEANWIMGLRLSQDGKRVIAGMSDGVTFVFDAASGDPIGNESDAEVREVSEEDESGNYYREVRIFSPANPGEPIWTARYDEYAVLAEDGVIVGFAGARGEVRDLATGKQRVRLTGHMSPVTAITGVAGGGVVLTGDETGEIRGWSIVPRQPAGRMVDVGEITSAPGGKVYALSLDGRQVSSVSADFSPVPVASFAQPVSRLQVFSERMLAVTEGGEVVSASLADPSGVALYPGVRALGALPADATGQKFTYIDAESQLVLSGTSASQSRFPENDEFGWKGSAFAEEQNLVIGADRTKLVAFNPESQEIAWTFEGFPEDLALREAAKDNEFVFYRELQTRYLLLNSDGSRILLVFDNSPRAEYNADHAVLLDTATGAIVMRLPFGAYENMSSAQFSSDGTKLVTHSLSDTGSTPDFRVWRTADGALLSAFSLPKDPQDPYASSISGFSVSPSGKRVASVQEGGISVWGTQTGRRIADITADLSEDGKFGSVILAEDHAAALNGSAELLKIQAPDEAAGSALAARACQMLEASNADAFAPVELARVSIPEDRRFPCARGGLMSLAFYSGLVSD